MTHSKTLVLFNYDWDKVGFERATRALGQALPDEAGFDLFSFPSNAHLAWFDLERFVKRLARQAKSAGWTSVVSSQEQFGALAAAMLAEKMQWPGTPVDAVLACQHKLYARQVLQRVCPEANLAFAALDAQYGAPIPDGLNYPLFVKPVKAAFSVLARHVANQQELHAHTRFGAWELWVIRHLVEPFERVFQSRLGPTQSAHRLLTEESIQAPQFNLDAYVWNGVAAPFGVVDAIMYPGTQAFMRWDYPSRLADKVQQRALAVAQKFLGEVGFTQGMFNMEFFYDEASDRLSVIEFNPRMASQFSDLYLRVDGVDLHACTLALGQGTDPGTLPRRPPVAGAASSLVYRSFVRGETCPMPNATQNAAFTSEFPDALLFCFPKDKGSTARDFKWLGSYRYGIVHLGGADAADLKARAEVAGKLLGWPSVYATEMPIDGQLASKPPQPEQHRLAQHQTTHHPAHHPVHHLPHHPLHHAVPTHLLEPSKS